MRYLCLLLCLIAIAAAAAEPATPPAESKTESAKEKKSAKKPRVILGRIEYVVLRDVDVKLKARIDTGAGVSSVHAKILEIKKTDQGEQVHFEITDGDGKAKPLWRDVVGWANIKVMNSSERSRRPIVRLDVCIGGKKLVGRVNLNDRGEFLYPMLIGRNLLNTGKFLVDPSKKYLRDPDCK
ncbi:MAG: ATP-dependent zinc protease [Pirellulales bacterium]